MYTTDATTTATTTCATARNYYLVEAPTGKIFVGSSMRKLTARINAGIKDPRRWLRHQGFSWLKTGKSVRGLYKQHAMHTFTGADERDAWLKEHAVEDHVVV